MERGPPCLHPRLTAAVATALTCSFPSLCLGTLAFLLGRQEQKRIDGTTREVKKVRKARNRRQEWNMMAYDKELRPDTRLSQSAHHGASSEGSLSPDTRCVYVCVCVCVRARVCMHALWGWAGLGFPVSGSVARLCVYMDHSVFPNFP